MHHVLHAPAPALRHGLATRLIHGGLAVAVATQLVTSLAMQGPDEVQPGDLLFQVHKLSGLAATVLALAFWMVALSRHKGTALGALLPWFSARRLRALGVDLARHVRAALRLRLPPYDPEGALAPTVHGLGLSSSPRWRRAARFTGSRSGWACTRPSPTGCWR
ncbi:cytochrome b/b6 domain-containing protein [Rubellimicrobium aerolatum]|uniref:Cytochrome b/b6 domain-containing protein n=1 Tax=Rubellimicrobium aerolatum TaxID=490979 RepID=A0ABW0SDS0_9RHOB